MALTISKQTDKGMKVPFGDLSRRYRALRGVIDRTLSETMAEGSFILGPRGARFEEAFAVWSGSVHAVGVASGTDALFIALRACDVGPGDEVITVANTCVPTVTAISMTGATPVLVDADPVSYTMDAKRIAERVTERTRVIMPVHLYGQMANMDAVMSVAAAHKLRVVEDCAQSHGATYGGRKAGTIGDIAAFSFYPSKNLGAFGDGGMITTSDAGLADRCRLLRNYGQRQRYVHLIKGINSRLDDIQAALLHAQLDYVDGWNARRREIAARYSERLRGSPIVCPEEMDGRGHVFHLYVVRVPDRDSFMAALETRGVETKIHYPVPIHRQPAYRELSDSAAYLPVTEQLAPNIVSLPIFPELTDAEVEYVAHQALRAVGC